MASGDRSRRPPAESPAWSTAPVVLVMVAGALSVLSEPLAALLDQAGSFGQFLGHHYLMTAVLVLAAVAGGLAVAARRQRLKRERPRSKVIPFPEHRRRRGA